MVLLYLNSSAVMYCKDIGSIPLLFGGSFQLLIACVWNLSNWLEYHIIYHIMMSPEFFGAYIMLDTDVMITMEIIRCSSIYTSS